MIVFTFFVVNDHLISVLRRLGNLNDFLRIALHNSREKFSSRTFVHSNSVGSPLGAAFFNIEYEDENDYESSVCSNAVESDSTDE